MVCKTVPFIVVNWVTVDNEVPVPTVISPFIEASVFIITEGVPVAFTVKAGKELRAPAAAPISKAGEPVVEAFPNCTVPPVIATVPGVDIL